MGKIFVGSFGPACFIMATVVIGACDKLPDKPECVTCPSIAEVPRVHATATASANVFVRCENGTTVTVNVTGYGEAYAATYEEAKKIADQKAQADLETAKAKAQASVTVVCGSTPTPTPPTQPIPVPGPNCTYAIVPKIQIDYQGSKAGNNATFSIGTQSGCRWSLESKDFWVVVPPEKVSGTGPTNNLPLIIAGNGPSARTGHVEARDGNRNLIQSIAIEQSARP